MPELAEVEFFRRRWDVARGKTVKAVYLNPRARDNRGLPIAKIKKALLGQKFLASQAAAKQMAFYFSNHLWLGIHLGMTGELAVGSAQREPKPHEHLVLKMSNGQELIFIDPRQFGRALFYQGQGVPEWWAKIAPPILSRAFTVQVVADFLKRHGRAPIKAVLLMQERFPGIGNWMADEVLWRAGFHPQARAGNFGPQAIQRLHRTLRQVCRDALKVIGKDWSDPPSHWLFNHRWSDGGKCPTSRVLLKRAPVGGRTTCWSPAKQKLGAERR